MAARLQNLSALFSNLRTRNIIFITGGIIVLAIFIGFIGLRHASNQENNQTNLQTERNIESVPGLTAASPEYAKVQQQLNQQQYQQAIKTHSSAIPTVIGQGNGTDNTDSNLAFPGQDNAAATNNNASSTTDGDTTQTTDSGNGSASAQGPSLDQPLTEAQQQQAAQIAQLQAQIAQLSNQQQQTQVQQTQDAMQQQAKQLLGAWTGGAAAAKQQFVVGANGPGGEASSAEGKAGSDVASPPQAPIIKAGDIMFAVLNTEVNSDEPGPIMATVVQGPLKGSKLVGSLQQTASLPGTNGPTRVTLNFSTLSMPTKANSASVSAVAIDPDTARTALASEVDHHYLERYGSLFASSFLQGYGQAVQQSGSVVTNNVFGGSNVAYGNLSGIEEVTAGLGQVGQEWGSQLGDILNRPNTIVVHSGVGLGILFLSDVTLDQSDIVRPGSSQVSNLSAPRMAATNSTSPGAPANVSLPSQ